MKYPEKSLDRFIHRPDVYDSSIPPDSENMEGKNCEITLIFRVTALLLPSD